MSNVNGFGQPTQTQPWNVALPPQALAGVRTRRVFAIMLDLVFVGALSFFIWSFLMVGTLGLAWFFLPPLFPIIAFFYNGMTISGPGRGTWGMRALDLQMTTVTGERAPFLNAAAHAVLYYLTITIFAPALLFSLLASDKRCIHDMLAGVIVTRRP
ncbi:MAG: RDD family protein [Hyphomicrobiales bacterium]|nr:RDD family protein [Hyphomicrobiales bacterium]